MWLLGTVEKVVGGGTTRWRLSRPDGTELRPLAKTLGEAEHRLAVAAEAEAYR